MAQLIAYLRRLVRFKQIALYRHEWNNAWRKVFICFKQNKLINKTQRHSVQHWTRKSWPRSSHFIILSDGFRLFIMNDIFIVRIFVIIDVLFVTCVTTTRAQYNTIVIIIITRYTASDVLAPFVVFTRAPDSVSARIKYLSARFRLGIIGLSSDKSLRWSALGLDLGALTKRHQV